jgi:Sulfotransferase domain
LATGRGRLIKKASLGLDFAAKNGFEFPSTSKSQIDNMTRGALDFDRLSNRHRVEESAMIGDNASVPAIKAFCVGQAKSGTASLAALLAANHRAVHEPERAQILEMILRESRSEVSEDAFRSYLLARDERLRLEYDIAWANQFLIGHLVTVFPDARFIILVRDPYTWLQSICGHLVSRNIPSDVRAFLDWWFRPDFYPHTQYDHALQGVGVYSIAAYLNAWNQHVSVCNQLIPPSRRLILRTHELGRSHQQLADFLQIPVDGLNISIGHVNRGTWSDRIESLVDRAYLSEMVRSICNENLACYFPEVASAEDAYQLWKPHAAVD